MSVIKELSRKNGLKIIIPVNDHEPKHVHIYKGRENHAKIEIETGNIVYSLLKASETAKVQDIVKAK